MRAPRIEAVLVRVMESLAVTVQAVLRLQEAGLDGQDY
jgi:hypothetical protein